MSNDYQEPPNRNNNALSGLDGDKDPEQEEELAEGDPQEQEEVAAEPLTETEGETGAAETEGETEAAEPESETGTETLGEEGDRAEVWERFQNVLREEETEGEAYSTILSLPADYDHAEKIEDYLLMACIASIVCPVLGIASIAKSYECRDYKKEKDLISAERASQDSKKCSVAGIILGSLSIIIILTIITY